MFDASVVISDAWAVPPAVCETRVTSLCGQGCGLKLLLLNGGECLESRAAQSFKWCCNARPWVPQNSHRGPVVQGYVETLRPRRETYDHQDEPVQIMD